MAHEFKIKLKPGWKGHEEALIQRVADCVVGRDMSINQESGTGYRWTLDRGNDWWADLRNLDDGIELTVCYRYGTHRDARTAIEGLRAFLEWSLR